MSLEVSTLLTPELDGGRNVPKRGISFVDDPTGAQCACDTGEETKLLSHWDVDLDVFTRAIVLFAGNSDWVYYCPLPLIRVGFRAICAAGVGITPWMMSIEDKMLHGDEDHQIKIRIYKPREMKTLRTSTFETAVGVLFIHGGGGWLGSIETHDCVARRLAHRTKFLTVSVEYRLVPEHTYVDALRDVRTAYSWLLDRLPSLYGADGARGEVVVCGDSAGGMYTSGLCVSLELDRQNNAMSADVPRRPLLQVPIYPCTDLFTLYPSRRRLAKGWLLSERLFDLGMRHWVGSSGPELLEQMKDDATLTVGRAPEALLKKCPPTLLMTAEFCPLHDEGAAFCRTLSAAGVEARHVEARGMLHGFLGLMGVVPAAAREGNHIFDLLRRAAVGLASGRELTATDDVGGGEDDDDAHQGKRKGWDHSGRALVRLGSGWVEGVLRSSDAFVERYRIREAAPAV